MAALPENASRPMRVMLKHWGSPASLRKRLENREQKMPDILQDTRNFTKIDAVPDWYLRKAMSNSMFQSARVVLRPMYTYLPHRVERNSAEKNRSKRLTMF